MIKIEVTQQDIDIGVKADCNLCPIALAATRAYGTPVMAASFHLYDSETGAYSLMPLEARNFIIQFDGDWAIYPFSFTMPAVEDWEGPGEE